MSANKTLTIYTIIPSIYSESIKEFLKNLSFGLDKCKINVNIVFLRGPLPEVYKEHESIIAKSLFHRKLYKNSLVKFFEIFVIILFLPFSIINQKIKYKSTAFILYNIEYPYFLLPIVFLAKLFGIKNVKITTDFYNKKTIVPVFWKYPKWWLYNWQTKKLVKYFDGIIVLSSFFIELLTKYGVKENRIKVIPHFINFSECSIKSQIYRQDNKIKIGHFGTQHVHLGLIDLIDSFVIVCNKYHFTELILSGKINPEIYDYVNKQPSNIRKNIKFVGYVSNINDIISDCDILVNPRKNTLLSHTGFPTKLGEYFATKKPVVSTNTGDISKYFIDKRDIILVEPDKPEKIAEGIIYLIENEEIAKEIGENGFLKAIEYLDYINNAQKVIDFIFGLKN